MNKSIKKISVFFLIFLVFTVFHQNVCLAAEYDVPVKTDPETVERMQVAGVSMRGDGSFFVVGYKDGGISVFSVENDFVRKVEGFNSVVNPNITSICFDPIYFKVFAGLANGSIAVFEERSIKYLTDPEITHVDKVNNVKVARTANVLISTTESGIVSLWDLNTFTPIRSKNLGRQMRAADISDDAKRVVCSFRDDARVFVLDDQLNPIKNIGGDDEKHRMLFPASISGDGRRIVHGLYVWDDLNFVRTLDYTSGPIGQTNVVAINMSHDGKVVGTGSPLNLWDVGTGKCLTSDRCVNTGDLIVDLSMSDDGKKVVTLNTNNVVKLRDVSELLPKTKTWGEWFRGLLDW